MADATAQLSSTVFGIKVLLVLDDVWDANFVAPLSSPLDEAAGSRMLISTRIAGLVSEGAREVRVGTLTEEEALSLLSVSSKIEIEPASPSYPHARDACKICGG